MKSPLYGSVKRAFILITALFFLLGVFSASGFRCIRITLQFDDFPACVQAQILRDDILWNLIVAAFISNVGSVAAIQNLQFRFLLKFLNMFFGFGIFLFWISSIASSNVISNGSIVLGSEA